MSKLCLCYLKSLFKHTLGKFMSNLEYLIILGDLDCALSNTLKLRLEREFLTRIGRWCYFIQLILLCSFFQNKYYYHQSNNLYCYARVNINSPIYRDTINPLSQCDVLHDSFEYILSIYFCIILDFIVKLKMSISLLSSIGQMIILLSYCILHPFNMNNSRYDLPKVKLRFKTDPSNSITNSAQITVFQKFDANPSVFLDRLKNGKEIHEAYMRYRKLKKHNYVRHPSNRKKSISLAECQKMKTMVLKRQCKRSLNKLNFALQTTFVRQNESDNSGAVKKNKFYEFINDKTNQDQQYERMQDLLINLKPQTVALSPVKFNHQPLLYQSYKNPIQRQMRLNPRLEVQKKYENRMLKKSKCNNKLLKQGNAFKLDPWSQDQISYSPTKYYYCNDDF